MKVGDMVMVVGGKFVGAVGVVVELGVLHHPTSVVGVVVRFPRPMPWASPGSSPDKTVGIMRKENLRVINDPPGQDETLTWLPVPQPVKETA